MSGAVIAFIGIGGISVSISPTAVGGTGSGAVTTNVATATGAHGVPPYSYSWSVDSEDGIFVVSPTSASTAFRRFGVLNGDLFIATATVIATDAGGQTASASIPVTISGAGEG